MFIAYAIYSAIAVGGATFAALAHHFAACGALLIVSLTLSYFGGMVRKHQEDRVLNPIVAWAAIGAFTGYGFGELLSNGQENGWRFYVGFFVGAILAGLLRWGTAKYEGRFKYSTDKEK